MKVQRGLPRRKFLQISGIAALSGNALLSCSTRQRYWRSLTSEEAVLVEAISEQVIPADQDPGGRQAQVVNFIDLQLAGAHKRFRKIYREGLERLSETCILVYGKSFVDLPFDKQTDLLVKLETNDVPKSIWQNQSPSEFLRLISDHCMQGFYGSPRHGGNQNFASWHMLGISYPQICGRNHTG